MRILISGYVLAEGRASMIRMGRTLCRHAEALLGPEDSVALDDGPGNARPAGGLSLKVRKRLLYPLRLRRKPFDVLHIVDSDYLPGVAASKLAQTVATCHDMMPLLLYGSVEAAFPGKAGRAFYRETLERMARCGCVGTDSLFSKECILRYTDCAPENVRVIYLGVEERFRPLAPDDADLRAFRTRHGLEGKRVVLHVGSTAPYKNMETVIRVVRDLRSELGPDVMLMKVGGAPMDDKGELAETTVRQKGLSEDDLVLAYNAADLLLWPSHFEGFGLPVLEAMACGTPVVCSNGGSLPEVADGAAAMHDAVDVEGLAASCRRILTEEPYREGLVGAGLERARQFSWDRTAREYYEVYRELGLAED